MFQTIANRVMTAIATLTAFGVFMHDGHLDKAMVTSLDAPVDASHIARGGHTHSDYNAGSNLLTNSFAYQSPSIPPKNRSERKHRLDLLLESGRHAFDDAYLPILS